MPISPDEPGHIRNGWSLYAWRGIGAQLRDLRDEVDRLAAADPAGYKHHPRTKLFAAVRRLLVEVIPRDPSSPEFLLGNTLGPENRHWRRAKFGGRFRLFFRFQSASRTIVYVWMNDSETLRKAGGRTDPYAIFFQMLERGRPPSDWDALLRESGRMDAV
jgi:toxin YhaV